MRYNICDDNTLMQIKRKVTKYLKKLQNDSVLQEPISEDFRPVRRRPALVSRFGLQQSVNPRSMPRLLIGRNSILLWAYGNLAIWCRDTTGTLKYS